jgi:hypothetical protein
MIPVKIGQIWIDSYFDRLYIITSIVVEDDHKMITGLSLKNGKQITLANYSLGQKLIDDI